MKPSRTIALIGILILTACASLPTFNIAGVDKTLLPSQVADNVKNFKGKKVIWGGAILSGKNLKTTTRLEILAYPLDSDGWPERDQKPLGRFILSHKGYLETADYSKGRVITVVGSVTDTEQAKVGQSPYTYPVITSQQLHLWANSRQKSGARVHFGIGVIFN